MEEIEAYLFLQKKIDGNVTDTTRLTKSLMAKFKITTERASEFLLQFAKDRHYLICADLRSERMILKKMEAA